MSDKKKTKFIDFNKYIDDMVIPEKFELIFENTVYKKYGVEAIPIDWLNQMKDQLDLDAHEDKVQQIIDVWRNEYGCASND